MITSQQPIRVLVVGCGNMGASHATAYHRLDGFEIVGLVATGSSKEKLNQELGGHYTLFSDFEPALLATRIPMRPMRTSRQCLRRVCQNREDGELASLDIFAKLNLVAHVRIASLVCPYHAPNEWLDLPNIIMAKIAKH